MLQFMHHCNTGNGEVNVAEAKAHRKCVAIIGYLKKYATGNRRDTFVKLVFLEICKISWVSWLQGLDFLRKLRIGFLDSVSDKEK
ncbi:ATP-dependent dethiobiotin synthetase BioD [Trichinella spiralis]|uniref:ATP-dependent dethiobiotin synthetase BioD n=1 Tax=Trichinella spiralis TaxID=6334 RepID=A0ABR3L183_TRISP